jgi:hypothetical protein
MASARRFASRSLSRLTRGSYLAFKLQWTLSTRRLARARMAWRVGALKTYQAKLRLSPIRLGYKLSKALSSRVGNRPALLGCEDEAIEWLKRHAD